MKAETSFVLECRPGMKKNAYMRAFFPRVRDECRLARDEASVDEAKQVLISAEGNGHKTIFFFQ